MAHKTNNIKHSLNEKMNNECVLKVLQEVIGLKKKKWIV